MPKFSNASLRRLDTCHPLLIMVFSEVIHHFDCAIIEGARSRDRQDMLLDRRLTQVAWPNSKHNATPSLAVDVAPYPIDWKDRDRFHYFAGRVMGIADMLNVKLRWGGDWDRDTDLADNNFDDLLHFELFGIRDSDVIPATTHSHHDPER